MDKTLPTTMLNYDDATRWIFDRINYERVCPQKSSAHFCLERIESFLALVGSPQKRIPAIHIAGTKGKGSTAAILDSILRNCGIRTGLFTSPHIHQFEERMRVDGEMPSPDELSALVNDLRASLATGPPDLVNSDITYFEVATLLAWMYFDRRDVEYVVLETGMGGRLDCTNVCHPIVTIITTIGLDHTHILGDTLAQIAAEKAGIIKSGIPVVTWAVQPEAFPVIADRAHDLGCPLLCGDRDILLNGSYSAGEDGARFTVSSRLCRHENLTSPLLGEHQARNSALAVVAADLLAETEPRVTPAGIRNGVSAVSWPLRFEIIQRSPTVVLDAAHNPQSAAALATTLVERFPSDRRRVLVSAAVGIKMRVACWNSCAPSSTASC